MILAGIAANAADFAAPVDQHEQRRQPFRFDERQVRRQLPRSIHAAQRRAQAFFGLAINRRDFAVEGFAPFAAGLLEHHQFGCARARQTQNNKHYAEQHGARKKFLCALHARQLHSLVHFIAEKSILNRRNMYHRTRICRWIRALAEAERQQIIERAQFDEDPVQQVAVAGGDGFRDQRQAGLGAIDQAAEFRRSCARLASAMPSQRSST